MKKPTPQSRPGFWRSAASEDSNANDVDAGRVILLAVGLAGAFNVVMVPVIILVSVSRGGEFNVQDLGVGIAAILGGIATLVGGGGAYMLMKGKGEGQPT